MSNQDKKLDTCGCCEGIKALTPARVDNLPGLSALAYRVGTHASFKTTMKSAISGQPALLSLTTRDDDDPAIALCDAWATVLDVLSFYQERIANEGYLRTATERRSILEMARSIGYELRPGVAASTYLAFTLETAQGAPSSAKIGVGTKAQSVPGQDELPQVFETIEEIEARAEWNELKPRQSEPKIPHYGDKEVYLKGVETGLKPGDSILFIGKERREDRLSDRWDFRKVNTITVNPDVGYTKVTWKEGLGWRRGRNIVLPAEKDFSVYAFRQRAAAFGHNAPDWRAMSDSVKEGFLSRAPTQNDKEWPRFELNSDDTIYLDALYPQILQSSWVVLSHPDYEEVYDVVEVEEESSEDFTITAKTTRLKLRGENLREKFNDKRRDITVFGQSERIELAEAPLTGPVPGSPTEKVERAEGVLAPVDGNQITLDRLVPGLQKGHSLIVSGKKLKAKVADSVRPNQLRLVRADGVQVAALEAGQILNVLGSPSVDSAGDVTWPLKTSDGTEGEVTANIDDIIFVASAKEDAPVSELAVVEEASGDPTTVTLQESLRNSYDRPTATVFANVAKATHGETKKEILGSGDGSQPFQKFELKQKPLTYVSAAIPSGTKSTLELRVNDLLWGEVSTLYHQPPEKRAYISRIADDGTVTVHFGDGNNGARPPTGTENISATYRIGTGLGGMVKAKQINMLMTQTLGVKGVINPLAPTGAGNPEKLENARRNAPLTVLTFDRIVSLQDYEDFASAFAGIGKAQANMLWDGEQRLVHITVAGADGGSVPEDSALYKNLIDGINSARHPDHGVKVDSYVLLTFNVRAKIQVDSSYIVEDVLSSVKNALLESFSFERRSFGQAITASEVQAIMQKVKGVIALDLDELHLTSEHPDVYPRLPINMADWEVALNKPAKLLTVNPQGITLTKMTI